MEKLYWNHIQIAWLEIETVKMRVKLWKREKYKHKPILRIFYWARLDSQGPKLALNGLDPVLTWPRISKYNMFKQWGYQLVSQSEQVHVMTYVASR